MTDSLGMNTGVGVVSGQHESLGYPQLGEHGEQRDLVFGQTDHRGDCEHHARVV